MIASSYIFPVENITVYKDHEGQLISGLNAGSETPPLNLFVKIIITQNAIIISFFSLLSFFLFNNSLAQSVKKNYTKEN